MLGDLCVMGEEIRVSGGLGGEPGVDSRDGNVRRRSMIGVGEIC